MEHQNHEQPNEEQQNQEQQHYSTTNDDTTPVESERSNSELREETTESWPSLEELEDEILKYKFKNKCLLEEALTHHSYPSVNNLSYERLEYVGDSVLSLLITKEQYFLYPDLPPGALTRLRAANVDTEKLARVAVKHGLHKYLRHKKPMLSRQIDEFTQDILDYPLHSNGLVDAPKALADIVESTIGAVFIDSGSSLDTVWEIFKGLLEPIINPQTLEMHPMTELFELCQKRRWSIKLVDDWKEHMTYGIIIEGRVLGSATCHTKKEIALNRAAKDALNHISQFLDGDDENLLLNYNDDDGQVNNNNRPT